MLSRPLLSAGVPRSLTITGMPSPLAPSTWVKFAASHSYQKILSLILAVAAFLYLALYFTRCAISSHFAAPFVFPLLVGLLLSTTALVVSLAELLLTIRRRRHP